MSAADMNGLYHVCTDEIRSVVGISYGGFHFRDVRLVSPFFVSFTRDILRATQIQRITGKCLTLNAQKRTIRGQNTMNAASLFFR